MSRLGRFILSSDDTTTPAILSVTTDAVEYYMQEASVYNVKDEPYGSAGDGLSDDSVPVLAAIAACAGSGGGIVYFPAGTYLLASALVLSSGVHLRGAGKGVSILYFTNDSYCITATGTLGAANTLTASAVKGATSLSVTDGTLIAAGDRLLLGSEDHFMSIAGTSAHKGEIVVANSVAVNTVTLRSPTLDSYTTTKSITAFADAGSGNVTVTSAGHGYTNGMEVTIAGTTSYNGNFVVANAVADTFTIIDTWVADDATGTVGGGASVYPMTMVEGISVEDMTIRRAAQSAVATYGIYIQNAEKVAIRNVRLQHHTERAIYLRNVLDGLVDGCSIEDTFYTGTGTSYAIIPTDASQNIRIANNYLRGFKSISTGKTTALGVPRLVTVIGNTLMQDANTTSAALGGHSVSELITYQGNTIHGYGSYGIQASFSNGSIVGNIIYAKGGIYLEDPDAVQRGVLVSGNQVFLGNYSVAHGIITSSSHVKIMGNQIIVTDSAAARFGIVASDATSGVAVKNIEIIGNTVYYTKNVYTGAAYGIALYGTQGALVSGNKVYRDGPAGGSGIYVLANGAAVSDKVLIDGNVLIDAQTTPTMSVGVNVAAGSTNIRLGQNTVYGVSVAEVSIPAQTAQVIDAAGDTISPLAVSIGDRAIEISNTTGGSITLTSAPTIAAGYDGQRITILNVGTQDVVLQDQGTLASSNLRLSANTITLGTRDSLQLYYSSTIGDWVQIGQVNVL